VNKTQITNFRFRIVPILDFGLRIADLMHRFALSILLKQHRRRRTLNPKSEIPNPKLFTAPPQANLKSEI